VPVVWGIHHTVLDPRIDKRRTMLVSRGLRVSIAKNPHPDCMLLRGVAAYSQKTWLPRRKKLEVVPNGFDLEEIKPDPAAPCVGA